MSISVNDIVKFDVLDEWIETGAKYAEKSWPFTYNRMGKSDVYQRARNIVKGIIAQEALGYILDKMQIKYEIKPREKWYEVNRFDYLVNMGNKKLLIDIKSFFIPDYNQLLLKEGTKFFLDCHSLIPKDQLETDKMNEYDIYVFAFLIGKEKLDQDLYHLQFNWLIHCMWEYEFFKPPRYIREHGANNLGNIVILSNKKDRNKQFIIGGTTSPNNYAHENILLDKDGKARSKNDYFQLFYLRSLDGTIPEGEIKVISEREREASIIPPIIGFKDPDNNGWDDIWIYNSKIYFVGFSTKEWFKNKSTFLKRFSKLKQFETKTDNYGVLVKDLQTPISYLADYLSR